MTLSSPDAVIATKDATLNSGANSAKGGYSNVSLTDYNIRYILAVYSVDGSTLTQVVEPQTILKTDATAADFSFALSDDGSYRLVAWADFVAAGSTSDLHYSTADLTNIYCLDDADACLNDESRDAYYIAYDVDITESVELTLTLTRPFAKVRIVTDDYDSDGMVYPDAVSVTYYDCTRFTALDATTGDVTGATVDGTTTYNAILSTEKDYTDGVDAEAGYRTLAIDYLLAQESEQSAIHFSFAATNGSTTLLTTDVSTSVPIQRNYLTTITGSMLTASGDISFDITDDFGGDLGEDTGEDAGEEIPSSIASADDLVTFLTKGDGAEGTYTITADIDMSGVTLSSGVSEFAGTLDGGGYSIKNLVGSAALFESTTSTATIENLVLDSSCSFTADEAVYGPFVKLNYGTVSGCVNNAAVTRTYDTDSAGAELIGGLVGVSYGPVTACTNNGSVSLSSEGQVLGGPAGIVAYMGAAISDCINNGTITTTALRSGATTTIYNSAKVGSTGIGGIVAYGEAGYSMDGCTNNGSINFTLTYIESNTNTAGRMVIGGLVGNPVGETMNSNNYGTITVNVLTSTRDTYSSKSYISCVGGIAGGDYSSADQNSAPITNCNNYGAIVVTNDASNANSTVGGIVGWSGVESAENTQEINGCTNSGEITIGGSTPYGRFGGVAGGTANLVNCSNTAPITVTSAKSTSYVGSLIGYHTYEHKLTGCTATGSVTVHCALNGTGGLIGCNGDKDCSEGNIYGNKVNCVITDINGDNTTAKVGLVVGRFAGTTASSIVFGTEANPITVAGTVLGTAVTSDNYTDYLHGTTNYSEGIHTFYTVYGE